MNKFGIRTNLIVLVGGLMLLPLCVSLIYLGSFLRDTVLQNTISTNQMLTSQVASSIDNTIHEINYVTSMLMVDQAVMTAMRGVQQKDGYDHYQARTYIAQRIGELESSILNAVNGKIAILTMDGYLLSPSNLARAMLPYEDADWHADILENGRQNTWNHGILEVFQELYPLAVYNPYETLCYGRTILDYKNEPLGIIFVMLNGRRFWDSHLQTLEQSGTDAAQKSFYIFDENRRLQACYIREGEEIEELLQQEAAIWECEPGQTIAHEIDGNLCIVSRMQSAPNYYVFTEERDNFFRTSDDIYRNIQRILLFVIILTVVVLFGISHTISAPLRRLIRRMEGSSNGLVEMPEEGMRFREMHDLAKSYNAAGYRILELIENIKEESRLREKEHYEVLFSQISPHFIFNTINSLKYMAKEAEQRDLVESLEALGTILFSVYGNQSDITAIENEMKMLEAYIRIMQMRYAYGFTYSNNVPLDLYDCEIPIFTLQPLVENAILHGMREVNQGHIVVSAQVEDGSLIVSVFNNGPSVDAAAVEAMLEEKQKSPRKMTGLGLHNVNSRIKILYGEAYGLRINTELPAGFEIFVRMPQRRWEGAST